MSQLQNSRAKRQLLNKVEQGRALNRLSEIRESMIQKRFEFCNFNEVDQFNALGHDQNITPQQSYQEKQSLDLNLFQTSRTLMDEFFQSETDQVQPIEFLNDDVNDGPMTKLIFDLSEKKISNHLDVNKMARMNSQIKFPIVVQNTPSQVKTPTTKDVYQGLQRANTSVKKTNGYSGLGMVEVKQYVFHKQNVIGCGSFSKVYRGFKIRDHSQQVAIKEIKISSVGERKLMQEIEIHQVMAHSQFIVQLFDYFIDKLHDTCYLVLEYCPQGSLDNQFRTLNKKKALQYFNQLLEAMKDLHENNIIHRDLKLENILIKNNQIKLADFGFARPLPENTLSVLSQKCGTPATMAPELIFSDQQKIIYTDKQDVWSLGVILHELVYKEHPFAQNRDRMRMNQRVFIRQKDPVVESFLAKSLQFDSYQRMSLLECFSHEITNTNSTVRDLSPQNINQKKKFTLYNDTLDVKPRRLVYGESLDTKVKQIIQPFLIPIIQPLNSQHSEINHSWVYQAIAYVMSILLMISKKTLKL